MYYFPVLYEFLFSKSAFSRRYFQLLELIPLFSKIVVETTVSIDVFRLPELITAQPYFWQIMSHN
jgi:hypothetical protein